jgi:cystathionine beta-lyase/cystathionine gamma-synthase
VSDERTPEDRPRADARPLRRPDASVPPAPTLAPETLAAHAGSPALPPPGGVPLVPPIVPASVFAYPDLASVDAAMASDRRVYRRYGDEATIRLEEALAALETPRSQTTPIPRQPAATRVTASGQAALALLLLCLAEPRRRRVVVVRPCYGGTDALLAGPLTRVGMELVTVDLPHPAQPADHGALVAAATDERTCAVVCEVITNPLIGVADVPAVVRAAHAAGAACIVDSTFATPFLFQPFAHGADAVFHSLSKYLSGHSDVIGGVAMIAAEHPAAALLDPTSRLLGAVPSPFDSWLALRGLRTAALRIERATENAAALAGWLGARAEVAAVHYPGLRGPEDEELAGALLPRGRGPMLTVELHGGEAAVDRLIRALRLVRLAPSLGDVATTVSHPARTSHRGLTADEREALGIGGGLLRVSAGIEALTDLVADFDQALRATG